MVFIIGALDSVQLFYTWWLLASSSLSCRCWSFGSRWSFATNSRWRFEAFFLLRLGRLFCCRYSTCSSALLSDILATFAGRRIHQDNLLHLILLEFFQRCTWLNLARLLHFCLATLILNDSISSFSSFKWRRLCFFLQLQLKSALVVSFKTTHLLLSKLASSSIDWVVLCRGKFFAFLIKAFFERSQLLLPLHVSTHACERHAFTLVFSSWHHIIIIILSLDWCGWGLLTFPTGAAYISISFLLALTSFFV